MLRSAAPAATGHRHAEQRSASAALAFIRHPPVFYLVNATTKPCGGSRLFAASVGRDGREGPQPATREGAGADALRLDRIVDADIVVHAEPRAPGFELDDASTIGAGKARTGTDHLVAKGDAAGHFEDDRVRRLGVAGDDARRI